MDAEPAPSTGDTDQPGPAPTHGRSLGEGPAVPSTISPAGRRWPSQGWVYSLAPGDEAFFERGEFEIIPFDVGSDEHLDGVIRFHDAEPWRGARSREGRRPR